MSEYFESKHLHLYIPDISSGVYEEIGRLSEDDLLRAIHAWSYYLDGRQTELPGVSIIEKIWERCLKEEGVTRFNGISYIYFQMCARVASDQAINYIRENKGDLNEDEIKNL